MVARVRVCAAVRVCVCVWGCVRVSKWVWITNRVTPKWHSGKWKGLKPAVHILAWWFDLDPYPNGEPPKWVGVPPFCPRGYPQTPKMGFVFI